MQRIIREKARSRVQSVGDQCMTKKKAFTIALTCVVDYSEDLFLLLVIIFERIIVLLACGGRK